MAFCMQCGNQLNEGSAFCGKCGAKVYTGATQSHPTNNGFFNQLNSTVKKAMNGAQKVVSDISGSQSANTSSNNTSHTIYFYRKLFNIWQCRIRLLGIDTDQYYKSTQTNVKRRSSNKCKWKISHFSF